MSIKDGKFIRYFVPIEWNLKIKEKAGMYYLKYTVIFKKNSSQEFVNAYNTVYTTLKKALGNNAVITQGTTDEGNPLITVEGVFTLEDIGNIMVGEFINLSSIADMTLREIFTLSIFGISRVVKR